MDEITKQRIIEVQRAVKANLMYGLDAECEIRNILQEARIDGYKREPVLKRKL